MDSQTLPWMGDPQGCFLIGRMGKPHGLNGEMSFLFTDDVWDRVDAPYLLIEADGLPVPFFFEEYRFRSDETALVKMEGVDSEADARRLTNSRVFFPRSLAEADATHTSQTEVVGFEVVDATTGQSVGRIQAVDLSTLNTLLHVLTPTGQTLLLPINEHLLQQVDKEGKRISISIPSGLLDL